MRHLLETILIAGVFAGPVLLNAQQKPAIKHVEAEYTNPSDGAEMFKVYCAACHGERGKGNGVAVPALRKAPPDLTLLTKNNGGKFPELRVLQAIRGDVDVTAHGSKDMPVWGRVFRRMHGDEAGARLRIYSVTKHIESIQMK